MKQVRWMQKLGVAALITAAACAAGTAAAYTVPYSTPAGFTLVDISTSMISLGASVPVATSRGCQRQSALYLRCGCSRASRAATTRVPRSFRRSCADAHARGLGRLVDPGARRPRAGSGPIRASRCIATRARIPLASPSPTMLLPVMPQTLRGMIPRARFIRPSRAGAVPPTRRRRAR